MNNKKLLGKRIKELRKAKSLTQEQLAEIINIETTSLSAIESGRHFPSMPTVEKIASALNVELITLFDFEHLKNVQKVKKALIDSIETMSNEKIIYLYKIAMGLAMK